MFSVLNSMQKSVSLPSLMEAMGEEEGTQEKLMSEGRRDL